MPLIVLVLAVLLAACSSTPAEQPSAAEEPVAAKAPPSEPIARRIFGRAQAPLLESKLLHFLPNDTKEILLIGSVERAGRWLGVSAWDQEARAAVSRLLQTRLGVDVLDAGATESSGIDMTRAAALASLGHNLDLAVVHVANAEALAKLADDKTRDVVIREDVAAILTGSTRAERRSIAQRLSTLSREDSVAGSPQFAQRRPTFGEDVAAVWPIWNADGSQDVLFLGANLHEDFVAFEVGLPAASGTYWKVGIAEILGIATLDDVVESAHPLAAELVQASRPAPVVVANLSKLVEIRQSHAYALQADQGSGMIGLLGVDSKKAPELRAKLDTARGELGAIHDRQKAEHKKLRMAARQAAGYAVAYQIDHGERSVLRGGLLLNAPPAELGRLLAAAWYVDSPDSPLGQAVEVANKNIDAVQQALIRAASGGGAFASLYATDFSSGDNSLDGLVSGDLSGIEAGVGQGGLGAGGGGPGVSGGTGAGTIDNEKLGPVGHGSGGTDTGAGYGRVARPGSQTLSVVRIASSSVKGALSEEVVHRTLQAKRAAFLHCYDRELTSNADLEGDMEASFVIGSDGEPIGVRTFGMDGAFADCVGRQIRRLRFPRPDAGQVEATIKFSFSKPR